MAEPLTFMGILKPLLETTHYIWKICFCGLRHGCVSLLFVLNVAEYGYHLQFI